MEEQYDIEIEYNNSEDESQFAHEIQGEELEALQKYAKLENKTVQQLFNEIINEFLDKNIKLIQENRETEYRLKERAAQRRLNQDLKIYLKALEEDMTNRIIIKKDDITKAIIISSDEYEYLLSMKKEKEELDRANTKLIKDDTTI